MKPAASCVTSSPAALAFLKTALEGFRLKFHPSAAAFLKARPRGLAVIDSSLPDMSGRDLVSVLRGDKRTSRLLLVLTGSGPYSPAAAALSLENGADEYFTFPPEPRLFRARLLNLLARAGPGAAASEKPAEYAFGPLRISPEARTVSVGGKRIRLTALEFDLLLYFLRNQGRVVSRTVLLEQVWRQGLEAGPRAVDKRIEALRSRLGPFGAKIRTVFGLGYLFKL
ncbi:MAG: response regulator transcription factor [Elusimicrobia bacterium]|nr:response regulator transcription factor [Elusimicrobiota bacterium]